MNTSCKFAPPPSPRLQKCLNLVSDLFFMLIFPYFFFFFFNVFSPFFVFHFLILGLDNCLSKSGAVAPFFPLWIRPYQDTKNVYGNAITILLVDVYYYDNDLLWAQSSMLESPFALATLLVFLSKHQLDFGDIYYLFCEGNCWQAWGTCGLCVGEEQTLFLHLEFDIRPCNQREYRHKKI